MSVEKGKSLEQIFVEGYQVMTERDQEKIKIDAERARGSLDKDATARVECGCAQCQRKVQKVLEQRVALEGTLPIYWRVKARQELQTLRQQAPEIRRFRNEMRRLSQATPQDLLAQPLQPGIEIPVKRPIK